MPDNVIQAPVISPSVAQRTSVRDFLAMTKPGVNRMVVLTTLIGALLAFGPGRLKEVLSSSGILLATLLGTWLLAAASAVLNMVMERHLDRRMLRTADRPIASGRVSARAATFFGLVLTLVGTAVLAVVSPLATILGLLTLFTYLLVYTPLKGRTPWATYLGAVPGALPPVMGWAVIATTGGWNTADLETAIRSLLGFESGLLGWVLFGILFFWQLPHFFAIGWMHREDYARGGHEMLSVRDPTGRRSGVEAVVNTLMLIAVSVVPYLTGMNGPIYLVLAMALGAMFLVASLRFASDPSQAQARSLLLASLLYLPLSLAVLFINR